MLKKIFALILFLFILAVCAGCSKVADTPTTATNDTSDNISDVESKSEIDDDTAESGTDVAAPDDFGTGRLNFIPHLKIFFRDGFHFVENDVLTVQRSKIIYVFSYFICVTQHIRK